MLTMAEKMIEQARSPPAPRGRQLPPQVDPSELLVQEANHRIKNSLHLVATMLHLQARAETDLCESKGLPRRGPDVIHHVGWAGGQHAWASHSRRIFGPDW
ncbi:MAG: sensor histidine kinase [Proteobacteria bacterium]|nr:MAG: sensor histidine kinase [Pseudomonadota bacterium]